MLTAGKTMLRKLAQQIDTVINGSSDSEMARPVFKPCLRHDSQVPSEPSGGADVAPHSNPGGQNEIFNYRRDASGYPGVGG